MTETTHQPLASTASLTDGTLMSSKTTGLAWHYTTAKSLPAIMATGFLRAHDHATFSILTRIQTKQKPHLWFTKNQFWEPSILPCLRPELRELDGPERDRYVWDCLMESGGSWVRFGVHGDTLWPIAYDLPTPSNKEHLSIYDVRVSFENISIERCVIDSMDADLEWQRIYTPKLAWLH